jgi:hypothetical protein
MHLGRVLANRHKRWTAVGSARGETSAILKGWPTGPAARMGVKLIRCRVASADYYGAS